MACDQQLLRLLGGHRLSEVPALTNRRAQADYRLIDLFTLDALDANGHRECRRQCRDGTNDRCAFALCVEVGNEAAVDLDDIERQRPDMRERGEAGTEVVERQPDALVLEARNDRASQVHVREQRSSL